VSWFAVHYVLKKSSHPAVKGVAKFLLLVIAYFVRKNSTITPALSLGQLEELLGVDNRTIRRNRDLLCSPDVGELERHVQGKLERYRMLKLAGPLFVDQRFDYADKLSGSSAGMRANSPHVAGGPFALMRANSPDLAAAMRTKSPDRDPMRTKSPDPASGVHIEEEDLASSSEESQGEDAELTEQQRDEKLANLREAVAFDLHRADRFCDWWTTNYPTHNRGVLNRVRRSDRDAAFSLLSDGRTVERLEAMAVVLWAVTLDGQCGTRSDRAYIVESDKSICVLLQKATVIEREVVRLGLDAPSDEALAQLEEEHATRHSLPAHLERVRQRLRQAEANTSTTPFGELLVRIGAELSTLDTSDRACVAKRLVELDAEILQAAQAAVDADRLRAEADEQLAGFRLKMQDDAYQRARRAAMDRLLRERFQLPVLMLDGPAHGRATGTRQPAERTA
jgi:hypothetical protein